MAKASVSNVEAEDNGHAAAFEPTHPAAPAAPPPPPPPPPPSEGLGVRKVISTIPVRKPNKSEWFRVRPGPEWRLQTAILEVEAGVDRAVYLVHKSLWADLSGDCFFPFLVTY